MKPKHIKEKRRKEVFRIYKRIGKLYDEMKSLGYVKLKKPIRHGWYRELIITKEISKYKHADAYLEVYHKIQPSYWGSTKEKAQREWDYQCSIYMLSKDKPTISKKKFNKLSEKAKSICVPFRYKTSYRNSKIRFYVNFPKSCTKIKYTRAYITYQKVIDPKLESEMKLLFQQLEKHGYYEEDRRFHNYKENQFWNALIESKKKNKVKKALKKLQRESVEDLIKENTSWEIN